jgi:hypothetical protein
MKKLFIPAALAAALLSATVLPSCKKSDDNGGENRAAMIVGTWTAYQTGEDTNGNGSWDADERVDVTGDETGTATFNADGSGSANITISGTPLSIPLKWNLQNSDNDFRVILNTPFGSDTSVQNIVKLTSSDFELRDPSTAPPSYTSFKK